MDEEKGFVIKDRRSLDEKGDLRQKGAQAEAKPKEEQTGEPHRDEGQKIPLPEVSFSSLLISLSSSALLHLGEIADPYTGQKKQDLALAKHTIDTMAMLKEKTKGNLTDDEKRFLESVLADLRWRYVRATE
ncbi:MAG: DUF1844 domain-containing protein [Thermodesulfobacteriota bacterium]